MDDSTVEQEIEITLEPSGDRISLPVVKFEALRLDHRMDLVIAGAQIAHFGRIQLGALLDGECSPMWVYECAAESVLMPELSTPHWDRARRSP